MLSSNGISFTAEASREETEEILNEVDRITKWDVETQEDMLTVVTIKTDSKDMRDICRQIFFAFANHKIAVLEMASKKANLEDVFIELTEGESGVGEE